MRENKFIKLIWNAAFFTTSQWKWNESPSKLYALAGREYFIQIWLTKTPNAVRSGSVVMHAYNQQWAQPLSTFFFGFRTHNCVREALLLFIFAFELVETVLAMATVTIATARLTTAKISTTQQARETWSRHKRVSCCTLLPMTLVEKL